MSSWWDSDDATTASRVSSVAVKSKYGSRSTAAKAGPTPSLFTPVSSSTDGISTYKEAKEDDAVLANRYLKAALEIASTAHAEPSKKPARKAPARRKALDVISINSVRVDSDDESPKKDRTIFVYDALTAYRKPGDAVKQRKVPLMKRRIIASVSAPKAANIATVASGKGIQTACTGIDVSDEEDCLPELNVVDHCARMSVCMRRVTFGMSLHNNRHSFRPSISRQSILPGVAASGAVRQSILPVIPGERGYLMKTDPGLQIMKTTVARVTIEPRLGRAVRVPLAIIEDDDTEEAVAAGGDCITAPSFIHPEQAILTAEVLPPVISGSIGAEQQLQSFEDALDKSLSSIFQFLDAGSLLSTVAQVSKTWRSAAAAAYSWKVANDLECRKLSKDASAPADSAMICRSWQPFLSAFPWGVYLADGAYKQVHKVYNSTMNRLEAISVMDVQALAETGNLPVVQAEIQVGLLASELVSQSVCPNFVQMYQVFLHAYSPSLHFPEHWGCAEVKAPKGQKHDAWLVAQSKPSKGAKKLLRKPKDAGGEYQYTRMELCLGGDLEGFLRELETSLWSIDSNKGDASASISGSLAGLSLNGSKSAARTAVEAERLVSESAYSKWAVSTIFQMVAAVVAARSSLQLRHNDIKCLNYFMQPASACHWPRSDAGKVVMRYNFGKYVYDVPLDVSAGGLLGDYVVKLADFGTAEMRPETLHTPIKAYNITTVENMPPEYYLWGSACKQSYAADTWGLGLSVLHVLTGCAPYEELMGEIACPPELAKALLKEWQSDATYGVLKPFLADADTTVADTLYRLFVLLEPAIDAYAMAADAPTKIWDILRQLKSGGKPVGISAVALRKLTKLHEEHCAMFSLWRGSHPVLRRAQGRFASVLGSKEIVQNMLVWDPAQRLGTPELLAASLFESLRTTSDVAKMDHVVQYNCQIADKT